MGHYIETDGHEKKADYLLQRHQEMREITREEVVFDESGENVLVCVFYNVNDDFDAAAICCNREELELYTQREDFRWKRWLVMPRNLAIKLCPKVVRALPSSKRRSSN